MKETKKLLLVSLIIFLSLTSVYSQDNVGKVGLGILYGNIKLGYERVISDNQSVTINAGISFPRDLPGFIEFDPELENVDSKWSSFSISSEYRFYLGKNDAPKGFYLGPYARLSNYSFMFYDFYDGYEVCADNGMTFLGIGLQLGYQWVISDLITIDWYFLGLGVDRISFSSKLTSDDLGLDYQELEKDLEEELEDAIVFGDNNLKLESGDDYLKMKNSLFMPGIRMGISLGIAF